MSAALQKPRGVIFDWDNTLVDSWPAIGEAINHTRARFGLSVWSDDQIKANCTRAARDSFPEWFGDQWEKAYEIYYRDFDEIRKKRDLKVRAGAYELLVWLKTQSIPCFIVSNKRGDYLRIEVERLKWNGFFQAVAGAQDAPKDKPHREHVDFALKDSGLQAGPDLWFVGDSETDMLCAHNSGCTPVLVDDGPLAAQLKIDLTFPDCVGLLACLGNPQP